MSFVIDNFDSPSHRIRSHEKWSPVVEALHSEFGTILVEVAVTTTATTRRSIGLMGHKKFPRLLVGFQSLRSMAKYLPHDQL